MALVSCQECGKEISDKAASCPHCGAPQGGAVAQPIPVVVTEVKKGSGVWKWILGIPVALFVVVMVIGATVGNTPEARQRSLERDKIAACWDLQKKKSLDPSTARFTAGMCERMEDDFRRKHNLNP